LILGLTKTRIGPDSGPCVLNITINIRCDETLPTAQTYLDQLS